MRLAMFFTSVSNCAELPRCPPCSLGNLQHAFELPAAEALLPAREAAAVRVTIADLARVMATVPAAAAEAAAEADVACDMRAACFGDGRTGKPRLSKSGRSATAQIYRR